MTPKGWREASLGTLGKWVGGGTPSKNNGDYWAGSIPWVSPKDMKGARILDTEDHISDAAVANSATSVVPNGSVLVVTRSGILRHTLPVAVAGRDVAINQDLKALLPGENVVGPFAFQLLSWLGPDVLRQCAKVGTTVESIDFGALREFRVVLPPLAEQRTITAILSSVDDTIESTHAVMAQLRVVKKASMAELLTRGIPGRHTRFKQTEVGEIPEAWQVARVGDVCSPITKGATPAAQTRDSAEIPFLKVYNLDPKGVIDFTYQPTFIPRSVHEGELRRSQVRSGDVLMNIVGPPLGKVAIVPTTMPEANINQAIAVMRPAAVEAGFLAACLAEPKLFSWAQSRAKRTSTQLNLTLELCRDYPIPLPGRDERDEIVTTLGAIEERLRAEESALAALEALKSALMSVLLTGEVRVPLEEHAA